MFYYTRSLSLNSSTTAKYFKSTFYKWCSYSANHLPAPSKRELTISNAVLCQSCVDSDICMSEALSNLSPCRTGAPKLTVIQRTT